MTSRKVYYIRFGENYYFQGYVPDVDNKAMDLKLVAEKESAYPFYDVDKDTAEDIKKWFGGTIVESFKEVDKQ